MKNSVTEKDRYKIEIYLSEKFTISQIAEKTGHKYHTIYQEIKRGTVKQIKTNLETVYVYKADYAQMVRDRSCSNRGRNLKIGSDMELIRYIEKRIKEDKYSPEAVVYEIQNSDMKFDTSLCFKTIYNYIDQNIFLNLKRSDLPLPRKQKKKYSQRSKVALNNRLGRSIEERPDYISNRSEYGHWEMDTVVSGQGKGRGCLLVLSERMSREELIVKLKDKKSDSVVKALNKFEKELGTINFRNKFKSITCDNGVEFLDAAGIEKCARSDKKRTVLYYAHPYSSYERGTNENINRMIRRFFPKGTNFDRITDEQVKYVEQWINHYPRNMFGGLSSIDLKKKLDIA